MTDHKLVMVDKDLLRNLRAAHNEMAAACKENPGLPSAWLMIGHLSSLLDTLMAMLIGEDGKTATLKEEVHDGG